MLNAGLQEEEGHRVAQSCRSWAAHRPVGRIHSGCRWGLHADQGPKAANGSQRGQKTTSHKFVRPRGPWMVSSPAAVGLSWRDKAVTSSRGHEALVQLTNLMWYTKQEHWPLGSWGKAASVTYPAAHLLLPRDGKKWSLFDAFVTTHGHACQTTPFPGSARIRGQSPDPRNGALPSPLHWGRGRCEPAAHPPIGLPRPTLGGKLLAQL